MYFSDMGPYNYYTSRPFPGVRAIGWLDGNHTFSQGVTPVEVLAKLRTAMVGNDRVNIHVNPIRGVHPCNLCGAVDFPDAKLNIGVTEIWIPDGVGGYFASPSMLIHYITDHNYLPPREFMEAVERLDLTIIYNAQEEYENIAATLMS